MEMELWITEKLTLPPLLGLLIAIPAGSYMKGDEKSMTDSLKEVTRNFPIAKSAIPRNEIWNFANNAYPEIVSLSTLKVEMPWIDQEV